MAPGHLPKPWFPAGAGDAELSVGVMTAVNARGQTDSRSWSSKNLVFGESLGHEKI